MEEILSKRRRSWPVWPIAAGAALLASATLLAGCGSGAGVTHSQTAASRAAAHAQHTATMLMADVGSLNPLRATSTEDAEIDWVVYLGVTTRRHGAGSDGEELVPGVATTLPRSSAAGRTYVVTLRRLRFSDGRALRPADVTATVRRVLRAGPASVRAALSEVLVGARAYAAGRARSLAGVDADGSRRVVFRLRRRDPGFAALLAAPSLGIVPADTRADETAPPGIGPYRIADVVPGRSFALLRTPSWRPRPGIPAGHLDLEVTRSDRVAADTLSVLNDVTDVFDSAQTIPPRLLAEVRAKAAARFAELDAGGPVQLLYLDARVAPFDRRSARQAVLDALGDVGFGDARGTLIPGCGALRAGLVPGAALPCPNPTLPGDLVRARALVRRSRTDGETVVVASPAAQPVRGWMEHYASVLRSLGYVAEVKVLATSARTGESGPAQTGVAAWSPGDDSPWALLSARDGRAVSAGDLASSALAYVIGEDKVACLTSARLNADATIVDPDVGLDLSSLALR